MAVAAIVFEIGCCMANAARFQTVALAFSSGDHDAGFFNDPG